MSVEFDPIKLGPRRRRVDPLVIGVLVVAIGLAVAVVKPWVSNAGSEAPGPSAGLAIAPPAAPSVSPLSAAGSPAPEPTPTPPPTWTDIAPVVDVHRHWGVEAVLQLPATTASQGRPTRDVSYWSPVAPGPDGPQSAYIARDDQSIIALGVTFPPGEEVPEDVRIWLVHAGNELEWIDARMVVGGIPSGAMLFVRPTVPGVTPSSWPGGHYRIDALVSGQVRRISVQIPSRLGSVAGPDPWPTTTTNLVAPTDSDLSQVHAGLFATANGVGVALGAMAGPSLSEAEAWLQVVGQAGRPGPRAVPTVYLPGATALGVMLPKGSSVHSALVRRLAPDPNFTTGLRFDGISSSERPSPYTLFAPRGGGAIPPGDYGFEVRWTDDAGEHDATWHVELRPGPN